MRVPGARLAPPGLGARVADGRTAGPQPAGVLGRPVGGGGPAGRGSRTRTARPRTRTARGARPFLLRLQCRHPAVVRGVLLLLDLLQLVTVLDRLQTVLFEQFVHRVHQRLHVDDALVLAAPPGHGDAARVVGEHRLQRVAQGRVPRHRVLHERPGPGERALGAAEVAAPEPLVGALAAIEHEQFVVPGVAELVENGLERVVHGHGRPVGDPHVPYPGEVEALERRARADEAGDEVVRRIGQNRLRSVELRDLRAIAQHRDPVADLDRLVEVVRHEDDRLVQFVLEPDQLVLEVIARDRVDGAEGLVHEEYGRVRRERPRDAHALLLATGELPRITPPELHRVESHQVEHLLDALLHAALRPADHLRHERDVLRDGQVREEAGRLDRVADLPAQFHRVHVGDVLATDSDPSAARFDEPVDHFEQRRLAAARGPDEDDGLARLDLQAHVLDGGDGGARVDLGEVLQLDRRPARGTRAGRVGSGRR
ncbi:putative ABC transporter ATP-binding protein [Streptomyces sp. Tu6071]|nr:putative ABC transporter ATP-binding protein [Streptomyces sp. Tu6071]